MEVKSILDLDTPALLLHGSAADRNIKKAAAFVADKPVRLRPHFKNHKCVTLARRQLQAGGCVGMTCAKLAEAEILAGAGFEDVLVANQVVGACKVNRLAAVAAKCKVRVAVDSLQNAVEIAQAAARVKQRVGLLIELDTGMGRCGLPPGRSIVDFARKIADLPGVSFDGIQAYEGHAIGIMEPEERAAIARRSMTLAVETCRLLEHGGLPVSILSGSGTATYRVTGVMPGVDELQIGSYVTMDWSYHERVAGEFEMALGILATVISTTPDRFVLDVGVKGVGHEMGPPRLRDFPQYHIPRILAEEHCVVDAPAHRFRVGDKVELLPSHCCTTCNLYREIVVHENGHVVDKWPIEASGALT